MILSFIQDIDGTMTQQAQLNAQQISVPYVHIPETDNKPDMNTEENPVNENNAEQTVSQNTNRNKEPDRIQYSYDNSFESKYVHFKEKIEKDRLAWETFANRK